MEGGAEKGQLAADRERKRGDVVRKQEFDWKENGGRGIGGHAKRELVDLRDFRVAVH